MDEPATFHRIKIETCIQDEDNVSKQSNQKFEKLQDTEQVQFDIFDQSETSEVDITHGDIIDADVLEEGNGNVPTKFIYN